MAITQATSSVLAANAALNNLNAGTSIVFTKPLTVANITLSAGSTATFNSTAYVYGTGAAAAHRTALGLTTLATTTPATNITTFLATPTSDNLRAAVTNETGTEALVFANGPTLISPTINTGITLNATTYSYGAGAADAHRAALNINNVDNTSDVNKPISTAVATALSGKANIVDPVRTTLTGDGVLSSFAIAGADSLTNPSALIVAIDGALQEPSVDYTVSGGNITFTDPLASGAKAVVIVPSNSIQVGELIPSDGSVTSAKLAPNLTLTNATLGGSAAFTGTARPTSAAVGSPAATDLITRGDADARLRFEGPYVSSILLGGGNSGSVSLFRHVIQQLYSAVSLPLAPVAGVSSGWLIQPHFPAIASHGASYVSGTGSDGAFSYIQYNKPYTLAAMLELGRDASATSDVLVRFGMGNAQVTSNRLQGVAANYGWGVRIWQNSSSLWNIALYARCAASNTATITGATNASPIVVTFSSNHNLANGDLVEVTNTGGNTAADGIWTVANATATTIQLQGSTGNGVYTSGAIVNKITAPATMPFGSFQRILVTHNGAGQLTLRLGSMSQPVLLTLNGMTGKNITGQTGGGFFFGMQSVTSVTPYYTAALHEPRIYQDL